MDHKTKRKTVIWLCAAVILIAAIAAVCAVAVMRRNPGNAAESDPENDPRFGLSVVVQVGNTEALRVPLIENAVYAIIDGEATPLATGEGLAALGDDALPSRHDVNIIEIEDGAVRVKESNCANQVCVGMGDMTNDDYDFPVVCLPHRLIVTVIRDSG